ncbi:MAG: peptide deformylase [Ignavibacteriales bacterium]|nr:MAG: peptide deformylase [Ignavibacteriales bacterium]
MKKYTLKFYPDPVLREICLPVTEVNSSVIHMIKKMSKIMYRHKGIGLAAPQVGSLNRVIVADIGEGLISMINPEILTGFGEGYLEEGCLSLPETVVNVKRQQSVFVHYLDNNEIEKESELDGLTARVIQHEIDHLNGVLIIDYAPMEERINLLSDLKI